MRPFQVHLSESLTLTIHDVSLYEKPQDEEIGVMLTRINAGAMQWTSIWFDEEDLHYVCLPVDQEDGVLEDFLITDFFHHMDGHIDPCDYCHKPIPTGEDIFLEGWGKSLTCSECCQEKHLLEAWAK